jgi:hypothetical protein
LKSTEASKIPVFRVHSTVRTFGTLRGLIQWSADEFAPQSASGFVVPSPSRSCITATPRSRCFGRRSFSAAASARSVSSIGALSSPAGSCETNARFQQNLSLQHRPWTSEAGRERSVSFEDPKAPKLTYDGCRVRNVALAVRRCWHRIAGDRPVQRPPFRLRPFRAALAWARVRAH